MSTQEMIGLVGLVVVLLGIVFHAGKMRKEVDDHAEWQKGVQAQLSDVLKAFNAGTAATQTAAAQLMRFGEDLRGLATKQELHTLDTRLSEQIKALAAQLQQSHQRTDELIKKSTEELHDLTRRYETQQLQISGMREKLAFLRGEQGKEDRGGSSPDNRP